MHYKLFITKSQPRHAHLFFWPSKWTPAADVRSFAPNLIFSCCFFWWRVCGWFSWHSFLSRCVFPTFSTLKTISQILSHRYKHPHERGLGSAFHRRILFSFHSFQRLAVEKMSVMWLQNFAVINGNCLIKKFHSSTLCKDVCGFSSSFSSRSKDAMLNKSMQIPEIS